MGTAAGWGRAVSSDWREFVVPGKQPGEEVTINDELNRLRRLLAENPGEAFESWLELAMGLVHLGIPEGALEVLAELQAATHANAIAPDRWPWLMNTEGIAAAALGRPEAAERAYLEMYRHAETLPIGVRRDDLMSTAQQNLGNLFTTKDPERATVFLRDALVSKEALGDYESAAEIRMSLGLVELERGALDEAERLFVDVLAAAESPRNVRLLGAAWANRGNLWVERHDLRAAEDAFKRALEFFAEDADPARAVMGMESLGHLSTDRGQFGQASHWYEQALELAEHVDSAQLQLRLHRALARLRVREARWEEAEAELRAAREFADKLRDRGAAGDVLADLGALKVRQGQLDEGEELLGAADGILREAHDERRLVDVTRNLAELAWRRGESERAEERLVETERILRGLGDDAQIADVLRRRAEVALSAGRDGEASRRFEEEFELRIAGGPSDAAAWQAATAGSLLLGAATPASALPFFDRAIAIYAETGKARLASRVRNDRALALAALGRSSEAEEELGANLSIAEQLSDRTLQREALTNLGELRARQGDLAQAAVMLRDAVELANALDDAEGLADAASNLLPVLLRSEQYEEAALTLAALQRAANRTGEPRHEASAVSAAASLAMAELDYARAVELFERAVELDRDEEPRHETESLAGLLESLVAVGEESEERLQHGGQELVTRAQETGNEDVAWSGLARAGGRALERPDLELATSLWATAVRLALVAASDESGVAGRALDQFRAHQPETGPRDDDESFLLRAGLAVMQVLFTIESWMEHKDEPVRQQVRESVMQEVAASLGEGARDLLRQAWEAAVERRSADSGE